MDDADKADINAAIRLKAAYSERLAQAANGARNGRLFCTLMVAACIAAFVVTRDPWFGRIAVVAAAPAGISCVVDHMLPGPGKSILALISYALSAMSALVLLATL